jgi:hypothetical protein
VEPRKWVQYVGTALEAAEMADLSNENVKQTIYESRKRSKEMA